MNWKISPGILPEVTSKINIETWGVIKKNRWNSERTERIERSR